MPRRPLLDTALLCVILGELQERSLLLLNQLCFELSVFVLLSLRIIKKSEQPSEHHSKVDLR